MKQLIKKAFGRIRRGAGASLPTKRQVWSIGIYAGKSPLALGAANDVSNPVLTCASVSDVPANFVADPFMLRARDNWYMFFEVLNAQSGKGEIGLASSKNAIQWQYHQIVLREPFHLSYPYTFRWNDGYYMVPESYQANAIRLYKAVDFPTRWSFVKALLEGSDFVDPTIFFFKDHWWLFTDFARPPFYAGTLRLFHAEQLEGPWIEHSKSPVVEGNPHIARPAGRVIISDGRIIRYAQDCSPEYGIQVRAFEITELTSSAYTEKAVESTPIIQASGHGWNAAGMHHVDLHPTDDGRWIGCVDGHYWTSSAEGSSL